MSRCRNFGTCGYGNAAGNTCCVTGIAKFRTSSIYGIFNYSIMTCCRDFCVGCVIAARTDLIGIPADFCASGCSGFLCSYIMPQSRDHFLLHQNGLAEHTMAAFCQAGFGAGGSNCGISGFGMPNGFHLHGKAVAAFAQIDGIPGFLTGGQHLLRQLVVVHMGCIGHPGDAAAVALPDTGCPGGIPRRIVSGGGYAGENAVAAIFAAKLGGRTLEGDLLQGGAVFKGPVVDQGDVGRDGDSLQAGAVLKHLVAQIGNGVGQGDLLQRRATGEGIAAELLDTIGNHHRFQRLSRIECGDAAGDQGAGQDQGLQIVAVRHAQGADGRYALGNNQLRQTVAVAEAGLADPFQGTGQENLRQLFTTEERAFAQLCDALRNHIGAGFSGGTLDQGGHVFVEQHAVPAGIVWVIRAAEDFRQIGAVFGKAGTQRLHGVRNGQAGQSGLIKGIIADGFQALLQCHAFHFCAPVKAVVPQGFQGSGQGNVPQFAAVGEAVWADADQLLGEIDHLQIAAPLERAFLQGCQTVRQVDQGQAAAVHEAVFADAGDGGGQLQRSDIGAVFKGIVTQPGDAFADADGLDLAFYRIPGGIAAGIIRHGAGAGEDQHAVGIQIPVQAIAEIGAHLGDHFLGNQDFVTDRAMAAFRQASGGAGGSHGGVGDRGVVNASIPFCWCGSFLGYRGSFLRCCGTFFCGRRTFFCGRGGFLCTFCGKHFRCGCLRGCSRNFLQGNFLCPGGHGAHSQNQCQHQQQADRSFEHGAISFI